MNNHSCIAVFAKAPIMGHVKTRLAVHLEETDVVALYRCFVLDVISKLQSCGFNYKIFYYPEGTEQLMQEWLGPDNTFSLQKGVDLGERMKNSFTAMFEDSVSRALLIGSDFPDLPVSILDDAFSELNKCGATIGPTVDGGYYLIGFNRNAFLPMIFEKISWGTHTVFEQTMRVFNTANMPVHTLSQWPDVDTISDLVRLFQSLDKHPEKAPETYRFLKNSGILTRYGK